MKTTLKISAALFFLSLSFSALSAQVVPTASSGKANFTGFQFTENWMNAAATCLGTEVNASFVHGLMTDESEVWMNENEKTLLICTREDAAGFEERMEEAMNASQGIGGAHWYLNQKVTAVEGGGTQYNYTVKIGNAWYVATCLLIPSGSGGTTALVITPRQSLQPELLSEIAAAFQSAVTQPLAAQ